MLVHALLTSLWVEASGKAAVHDEHSIGEEERMDLVASPGTRSATRTARRARRPFPARTLHLVDIENLAGTGMPTEGQVASLSGAYATQVGLGPWDQVIIGCNHNALAAVGHGWPGARYLIRSGPDGADAELLGVIAAENVASRFTHVTIASGDGAFAWAAAGLVAAGCHVTVASRPGALSTRLAFAACFVIRLSLPAQRRDAA